jgi:ABC-type transport system involved in multi-copper enzyme maturation permease subunit
MNNALAIAGVVVREMIRRKDFYVLFILTATITLLLGSMSFFNDSRVVRYLKEVCLLLIWISGLVVAIGTAARQIPAECESRTVFPLLAKPVTRDEVVFGKFLGCWFACGLALVVFYLFFGLITGIREHQWPVGILLQALWMQWWMLAIVIALTLLGSVVFAAPSSAASIVFLTVLGILLLGRHLNKIALQMEEPMRSAVYVLYFLMPHLELFDLRDLVVHGWKPVQWLALGGATLYAGVHAGILLLLTCLAFRRKPLS